MRYLPQTQIQTIRHIIPVNPKFKRSSFNFFCSILLCLCWSCNHPAKPPVTSFVGAPGMIRPLVLDCTMGKDINNESTLYICTYSRGNNSSCSFIGIDPLTGRIKIKHDIMGRIGPYHLATDILGRVYASIYGSGRAELLMYNPLIDHLEILVPELSSEDFSFGLASNPSGGVLFGTHGEGKIIGYNPQTSDFRDYGCLNPGNKYPKAILALAPDSVLIGSGAPAHLSLLNPISGQIETDILSEAQLTDSFVYNLWPSGGSIFCRLAPSGKMLILSKSDFSVQAELDSMAISAPLPLSNDLVLLRKSNGSQIVFNLNSMVAQPTDRGFPDISSTSIFPIHFKGHLQYTGINSDGMWWRWDPQSNSLTSAILDLPENTTRVTCLATGPAGSLYAGTYETNSLYRMDSGHLSWISLGNVAPGRTGEILAMATVSSQLYSLSYIEAVLCRYDPSQPWNPGKDLGSNPLEIGPLGYEQNRPFDMNTAADGKLYMATFAGYGKMGGALSSFDPETGQINVWRSINGDGNLYSLAPGPDSILFLGTSQKLEGLEPLPGSASVLAFDTDKGKLLDWKVNIQGCHTINALIYGPSTIAGKKILYGVAAERCFTINWPDTLREYFDLPPICGLVGNLDGIYAGGPTGIYRIDHKDEPVQVSPRGPGFSGAFTYLSDNPPKIAFAYLDSVFTVVLPTNEKN